MVRADRDPGDASAGHESQSNEEEVQARLDEVIDGCRASHRRLFETAETLDEAGVRAPSRLEGWSVGHVLTHLARNADSHTRMLDAALRGEAVEQYAGGSDERAGAIAAGAHRPGAEVRTDLVRATLELEDTWSAMTPMAWEGHGLSRGRPWPCRSLPYLRWREVEIHHVDLGAGYEPDDWPEKYVRRELPLLLATVPARLPNAAQERGLLAWLTGRSESPGELTLAGWESRAGNYFRGMAD